jgi:hypothetical protein
MSRAGKITLAILLVSIAGTARAAERPPGITNKLRAEVKSLADSAVAVMKEEDQSAIAIGDFVGPTGFDTNYGSGLRQLFIEEISALSAGSVRDKATLSMIGSFSYELQKIDGEDLHVIGIEIQFKRSDGRTVGKLAKEVRDTPKLIKDSELIAVLISPGAISLPVQQNRKQLNDKIFDATENKNFKPEEFRLRENKDSPFGMALLATGEKNAPKTAEEWEKISPRALKVEKGFPIVAIESNEVYAVHLFNDTKHSVAVTLTIDGVDVFAFSEVRTGGKFPAGKPKYSHYIIPPGGAIIPGWHISNTNNKSFLVTEYGKGISSLLKVDPNKNGIITASFALAWEGDNVPEEEKGAKGRGVGNETGLGPDVKVNLKETKKNIGVVREIVNLRYSPK